MSALAEALGLPAPSGFVLGAKSLRRLRGVQPELVAVVRLAIQLTNQDFTVFEGLRSRERQQYLVARGRSWTMDSRHLTGHAVDLVPWISGRPRWRWPECRAIARAVLAAAEYLAVPVEWGGRWRRERLDGVHYQTR